MPPSRAQLGGIAGSGVYDTGSGAPDYASIINAIAGGASTLIHNAYLRKLSRRQADAAAAQQVVENTRQATRDTEDRTEKERRFKLDSEKLRIEKIKAGFTPAHEETVPGVPEHDVELRAELPSRMPGVHSLESGAGMAESVDAPPSLPARLRMPALPAGSRSVDETYDPTKAEGYVKAIDTAQLRTVAAEAARKESRDAAMDRLERSAELTAERQLEHDQRVQKGKAAIVSRGLTANALEAWRKNMADGIIQNLDGDLAAAEKFLANDERGRTYGVRGLTGEDLFAAAGRFRSQAARAATGILGTTSPERAVEKVGQVRRLMVPGGKKADSTAATPAAKRAAKPDIPKADASKTLNPAEHAALLKLGWTDKAIADSGYVVAAPRKP